MESYATKNVTPSATPAERSWTTRRYRPGDEVDLLELFNREFGLRRSMDHWQWQFGRNPFAPPLIVLARRRSDDLLVGSHVVMPVPLNVEGKQVLAGHSLDLVVHRDFRRQGIFEATGRECMEWCKSIGVRAVFAFPNTSSYPGFIRGLGWYRILYPRRYGLRLGVRGLSIVGPLLDLPFRAARFAELGLRRLSLPRNSRLRFAVSRDVPEQHDDLWRACASLEALSIWKDARYLRWRYVEKPGAEFEFASLQGPDGPEAMAVLHRERRRTSICELLVRERDVAIGQRLVADIVGLALGRGDDRVGFFGYDQGFQSECLEGFRRRIAHADAFCGRGLDDPRLDALVPRADNWSLAYGDGDFV